VRGLILLSTFARHPSAGSARTQFVTRLWAQIVDHAPLAARGGRILGMPGQFGRPVPLAAALSYLNEPLAPGPDYRHKIELLAGFDARPWLGEVCHPCIVLHGVRDPVVPLAAGRELATLLPNALIHELACGHLG